jgi:RNA polymerase sigma-70 factor (ECF subfamily)
MDEIERLYRQHAPAILRFAWHLCGDRSTAEDIVSETFVRLIVRAPKLETRTTLAYLLAIARNTYLSRRRRTRREAPLQDDWPAPIADPSEPRESRARLAEARKALAAVPEGERAALLLRVDHDLSTEEIAAILGTSVAAVKVRIHRARLRLLAAVPEKEEPS